jgi:hypothetical protein
MWLAKGYGSLATAWRTLQGIEAMNMIRKGRARWVAKRRSPSSRPTLSQNCSVSQPKAKPDEDTHVLTHHQSRFRNITVLCVGALGIGFVMRIFYHRWITAPVE